MDTEISPNKCNLAESDIEEWLYNNPASLDITEWVGRQFTVPSGIIDLLGVKKMSGGYLSFAVVEIKNTELGPAALTQVCRYAHDIYKILRHKEDDPYIRKVVIGKSVINNQLIYEANALDVSVYSFDVKLSLDIGGPWNFTTTTLRDNAIIYERLAREKPFVNTTVDEFINDIEESLGEDIE